MHVQQITTQRLQTMMMFTTPENMLQLMFSRLMQKHRQHLSLQFMKMNLLMKTKVTLLNPLLMKKVIHTLPTTIMGMFTITMITMITNIQHVFVVFTLHIPGSHIIMATIPIITGILTILITGV